MRSVFCLIFAIFVLAGSEAYAGPVGFYNVVGQNPGGDSGYQGTATVERNGATYTVVWQVGDEKYVGTGIGAARVNGGLTFGDAANNDVVITVSYVSGDSFGTALLIEQQNGQWKGVWTYGGSNAIGTETWTPR